MYFNIPSNASSPVQVFLITMLTVITWNQDSKQLRQCSRERSRIVREVITKVSVVPSADKLLFINHVFVSISEMVAHF